MAADRHVCYCSLRQFGGRGALRLASRPTSNRSNSPPTSVRLATQTVMFIQCAADQQLPALLECATDSSKAPALLALLLSCLMRLLQQVGHNAAATGDVDSTRVAWMSFAVASVQAARMLVSTAVAGHSQPEDSHMAAAAACSLAEASSSNRDRKSGSRDSRTASKGRAADQPSASPCTEPAVISSMWLLLAGRAMYTSGVTLQAALLLGDSGSSSSSGTTAGTPGQHQQSFAQEQQQKQAP